MAKRLSAKERLLVSEYVARGASDQAGALEAAGYSPKSLEIFRRPHIKAAVDAKMRATVARLGVSTERLVDEISAPAFLDLSNIWQLDVDGQPYPDWSRLTPQQLRCVKSIRTDVYVEGRGPAAQRVKKIVVEFHDKLAAIDKLAKHSGFYEKDNRRQVVLDGRHLVATLHAGRAEARAHAIEAGLAEDHDDGI
jgi:phage terminase small subunit